MNNHIFSAQTAEEVVFNVFSNIVDEKYDIRFDKNLKDDYGFDSLDIIETFLLIEQECKLKFNDEEMENVTTYGDIVDVVNKKLKEKENE